MLEGYEVRRARNGREALDILRGWLPRLILLDLMMPVMDGWAFRAAQRQLPGTPRRCRSSSCPGHAKRGRGPPSSAPSRP